MSILAAVLIGAILAAGVAIVMYVGKRNEAAAVVGVIALFLAVLAKPIEIAWDRVFGKESTVADTASATTGPASGEGRRSSGTPASPADDRPSAQPSDPASPSDDGPPTAAVYHQDPLVLKLTGTANLDASPDDPQWRWKSTGRDLRFYPGDGGKLLIEGYATGVLTDGPASYETCRNATGYSDEGLTITAIGRHKTLCVITGEGRYSALRINSASADELSFDVATYAKDGD